VLQGLFIKYVIQRRKGGGLPWCQARAKGLEYKGITQVMEKVKNLIKLLYVIYGWLHTKLKRDPI
jgi:hypothetical protein